MRQQQKSWLLQNNIRPLHLRKQKALACLLFFVYSFSNAQVANFVNNGGFEALNTCSNVISSKAFYWSGLDTTKRDYYPHNFCLNNVPQYGANYQKPYRGNGFAGGTFLCPTCFPTTNRTYFRNTLKDTLEANKTYCVKLYVNVKNDSPLGMDGVGVFFGDNTLDTIKYGSVRVTYLSPQIENPNNNIITDTMNWIPITGTFTANGTEKYMVIGNFKTDANTNSQIINSTGGGAWCDLYVDEVSVMNIDLKAYAGRDTFFIAGDSLYLGRPSDVGIDDACVWYKLPSNTPIDTVAGFWVKPTTTCTYVVKQDICGMIKTDTVILHQSAIGISEMISFSESLEIYPQPATEILNIRFSFPVNTPFNKICIYNNLGQLIREEEIYFKDKIATVDLHGLSSGIYVLSLSNSKNETITRKLVITK